MPVGTVKSRLHATRFLFCMLVVGLMKVWFRQEMQRHAVTRELKRMELQVARLAAGEHHPTKGERSTGSR